MNECNEIRDMLYSFAAGECDRESVRRIESHLAACTSCAEEFEAMREMLRLTGLHQNIKPSHDLFEEIKIRTSPSFICTRIAGAAAVAAAALLLIVWLFSLSSGPIEPQASDLTGNQARIEPEKEKEQVTEKEIPEIPKQTEDKLAAKEQEKQAPPAPLVVPEKEKGPVVAQEERTKPEVEKAPAVEERIVKAPEPLKKDKVQIPEMPEPEKEPVILAQIGLAEGEIKVKRENSENPVSAGVLFNILPGDTVSTNSMGKARIELANGSFIYVNSNTNFALSDSGGEILINVDKGEIYIEDESDEGSVVVSTGFGKVRARSGRFGLKMFGKSKCLMHVVSGEVECEDESKCPCGRYGELTRAWFKKGNCQKGTRMRSLEPLSWALKLRPADDDNASTKKNDKTDKPGKKGKKDVPPGASPKAGKPVVPQKPDDPGKGGKVGPGPIAPPPPPGDGGQHGGKTGGYPKMRK